MLDVAVDSSSEMFTKDWKEKKAVEEEAESGRDTSANESTNEENGEKEAGSVVKDEEERGDGEEEEAEAALGKSAIEDDEVNDVDPKKQKIDEDD